MSLYKNTEGQTTGMPGDKVTFRMAVDFNGLSKARYLKNPTIVDLLPKGVSVTPETEVSTFYGTEAGLRAGRLLRITTGADRRPSR